MTDVFVLRNQHNQFLNKSLEWIATGESKTLYRTPHKDEMINQKVELTVKRPDLRIQAIQAEQANNGRIIIDGADCLPKAEPSDSSKQHDISSALVTTDASEGSDSLCS